MDRVMKQKYAEDARSQPSQMWKIADLSASRKRVGRQSRRGIKPNAEVHQDAEDGENDGDGNL